MSMTARRYTMTAALLATGFLVLAPSASAQVRRNLGGPPAPASDAPADDSNPTNTPPADGEEGEPQEEPQPERVVDPAAVGRLIDAQGPMWLLDQESVRKELNITEQQTERINGMKEQMQQAQRDAFTQMRERMREQGGGGRGGAPGAGGPGAGGPGRGGAPGPGGFGGFQGGPGGFGGFQGGPGGFQGGANPFEAMRTQAQQQSQQAIASVLTPTQIKRLQQIIFQAKGPMAVTEEELQNALKVMPLQREQIAAIKQEMDTKQQQTVSVRRELFTTAIQKAQENQPEEEDGDRRNRGRPQLDPETQAKMEQLTAQTDTYQKEALSKIGKVLTSRQKSDYNKLLGPKFDFSSIDLRTAGRGGFGGPGGGFGGPGGGGDRGGRGGGDRGGR